MLNDEIIGAYLDGELDEEKRALVEHWIANDKGAAARLERIRLADALVREAFPRVSTRGDDALAARIMGGVGNVVPLVRRQWAIRAAALAAACALGVFGGRALAPSPSALGLGVNDAIAHVLDASPSGHVAVISGAEVQPILSFETQAGELCRQYRVANRGGSADALACKEGNGWRLVAQAAAPATAESEFIPASGASVIDAAIATLGDASALDEGQERARIANRWRAD